MSKIHRPPMSLARIIRFMNKPERENRIVVVVGTVTNDVRIFKVPKMTVREGRGELEQEEGMLGEIMSCQKKYRMT